ncbi:MAG: pyridoxamine 5'-phosphate oxidase family protein [Egibacteraceae bacterium]
MRTEARGLKSLSPETCLRLLDAHPVHLGRIAASELDGQPFILPVNYQVDGTSVVIRTEPQSLIAQRAVRCQVAFEVDDVDAVWEDGWSVLVRGTAERVTDVVELERLRSLRLRPWAPGERSLYIRIQPTLITGRQIV